MAVMLYKRFSSSSIINTRRSLVTDSFASKVLGADYVTQRPVKKSTRPIKGKCMKFPLEAILEARRLHEQESLTVQEVYEKIVEFGYDISYAGVRNWCMYITFRHTEPALNSAPYLPLKLSAST